MPLGDDYDRLLRELRQAGLGKLAAKAIADRFAALGACSLPVSTGVGETFSLGASSVPFSSSWPVVDLTTSGTVFRNGPGDNLLPLGAADLASGLPPAYDDEFYSAGGDYFVAKKPGMYLTMLSMKEPTAGNAGDLLECDLISPGDNLHTAYNGNVDVTWGDAESSLSQETRTVGYARITGPAVLQIECGEWRRDSGAVGNGSASILFEMVKVA